MKSYRQVKRFVPIKSKRASLERQREREANPRPLRFLNSEESLPFSVRRAGPANNLPVYLDYKNGGTKVVTILRKYEGDVDTLADEFQKVCGESPIEVRNGRIEAKGDHKRAVVSWLSDLGF